MVWKITNPDIQDNLNKMVFDAMEKIVYTDDSRVVWLQDFKKYYGLTPQIIIELEELWAGAGIW